VDVDTLGRLARTRVRTIERLETVAEDLVRSGVEAAGYADRFRDALAAEMATSVGCKSVIAYRHGLAFDAAPPSPAEVTTAAGEWLREIEATGTVRLSHPVLLRFGLWEGARTGRPLQIHTGFGDTDLDLYRADPALMTDFLRATETVCPVMLLHTYPFQRSAGYLAQMFGHVYVDVGLAVNHTGAASDRVIAESLELAPFRKVLFSSDAWGLPELHLLGSWLFRRGLSRVVGSLVVAGDWSIADAEHVIARIGHANAADVYGPDPLGTQRGSHTPAGTVG
jgi:predicted TIM-barrel fold metal-dependent hydrolase